MTSSTDDDKIEKLIGDLSAKQPVLGFAMQMMFEKLKRLIDERDDLRTERAAARARLAEQVDLADYAVADAMSLRDQLVAAEAALADAQFSVASQMGATEVWRRRWVESQDELRVCVAQLAAIRQLADKWNAAVDLNSMRPSIVARAFASEITAVLDGVPGTTQPDEERADS